MQHREAFYVSTPEPDLPIYPPVSPSFTVEELLAGKGTEPIRSLDELRANTFEDEAELEDFLAFVTDERHRNAA